MAGKSRDFKTMGNITSIIGRQGTFSASSFLISDLPYFTAILASNDIKIIGFRNEGDTVSFKALSATHFTDDPDAYCQIIFEKRPDGFTYLKGVLPIE